MFNIHTTTKLTCSDGPHISTYFFNNANFIGLYSYLNATDGATVDARRLGIYTANKTTPARTAVVTTTSIKYKLNGTVLSVKLFNAKEIKPNKNTPTPKPIDN